MFDIEYFTHDPRPFFRFAKEIWPGQYQPSLAHYFIAELERQDKLLRNYTQNIDSLEHLCPITRLIQCHGSFSSATCRVCHNKVQSDEIKDEILQQKIPHCQKCSLDIENAILKPDIVFFGEQLPDDFHKTISIDKDKCDLLIVMGSSLKVKPVSLVSELLSNDIPQILINRERLPHKTFDIELLGNCDVIINEICLRLAKIDSSFQQLKLSNQNFLKEISYENFQTTIEEPPTKKQKISEDPDNSSTSPEHISSLRPKSLESKSSINSSSRKRPFSLLTNSSFNQDSTYISYPPRRYIFAGAEIYFSSDEDDDDESSDEEDLPRKQQQPE
jgi:NAD-dependent deacetylase sirtuin 1